MRLWHQKLIHYLPIKQLLGQHRECCALRGKGWGRKHSVVDYVFTHPIAWLVFYHQCVMAEMKARKIDVDVRWSCWNYRGKDLLFVTPEDKSYQTMIADIIRTHESLEDSAPYKHKIYPEHDNNYLLECISNLRSKHAELVNGTSLNQLELEASINGDL